MILEPECEKLEIKVEVDPERKYVCMEDPLPPPNPEEWKVLVIAGAVPGDDKSEMYLPGEKHKYVVVGRDVHVLELKGGL